MAEYTEVPCPLCGSGDRRNVYPATKPQSMGPADLACTTALLATYDAIVECRSCGLLYTSPRPTDRDILDNYRRVEDTGFLDERHGRELTYRRLLREMDAVTGGRRGKLLDVGCAMGYFPVEARNVGWDVEGIEPSRWAAEYARREFGLSVREGSIASMDLAPNSYDAITAWDVVEHLVTPLEDFRRLASALKPGGLLAFSTHSIASPAARIMGRRYPFLMSMHITHFSSRTTGLLCDKAGLRQVRVRPHLRFLRAGYIVKKLDPLMPRLAAFLRGVLKAVRLHDRYVVVTGVGIFNAYAIKR